MLDSYGGVLLAVQDEELVGTLALRVKWLPTALYDGRRDGRQRRSLFFSKLKELGDGLGCVAYLEQFAVAERWRGRGLAQRLLRQAERQAQAWQLPVLALHVQRDDWPLGAEFHIFKASKL